ncbi:hypothetical protein MNEG_7961, partial [Monoraphidium neglectum]
MAWPAGPGAMGQRPVLALLLLSAAPWSCAVRSPACPGGCIIATTTVPDRVCECVHERCSRAAAAPVAAALAALAPADSAPAGGTGAAMPFFAPDGPADGAPTGAPGPPPRAAIGGSVVPPRAALPDNCGFCDSGHNTYASFEDCRSNQQNFLPAGPAAAAAAYPQLAATQTQAVARHAAARPALAAAPLEGAGMQAAAIVCPWPVVAPGGDGVARTGCP